MKTNFFVRKTTNNNLFAGKVILSLDNNEWYYGIEENLKKPEKRRLMTRIVQDSEVINSQHVKFINEIFLYVQRTERNTAKRKKRDFYVDTTLFL